MGRFLFTVIDLLHVTRPTENGTKNECSVTALDQGKGRTIPNISIKPQNEIPIFVGWERHYSNWVPPLKSFSEKEHLFSVVSFKIFTRSLDKSSTSKIK